MKTYFWFLLLINFVFAEENNSIINGTDHSTSKIASGRLARHRPYQVQLYADSRFICSGAILNQKWVITAAHCIQGNYNFHVLVGTRFLYDYKYGQVYKVSNTYHHGGFDRIFLTDDVGLLKLERDIMFHKHVERIGLGNAPPAGTMVSIAGWGETENAYLSRPLLETEMRIYDNRNCKFYWPFQLTNQICLVPVYVASVTCPGDSGGPLIYQETLIGLVSFGARGCPAVDKPDMFTRISDYIDWIQYVVNTYS